jgi:hypothetical protein
MYSLVREDCSTSISSRRMMPHDRAMRGCVVVGT